MVGPTLAPAKNRL